MPIPYVDGGRGLDGMDCWGLVRHVLHHVYCLPMLKSFGHISADNKKQLTEAFSEQVNTFENSSAQPSAVAAGFRGNLLIHVGICINVGTKLLILETGKSHGVRLTEIRQFQRMYSRTEFYTYVSNTYSLPKQVEYRCI